MWILGTGPIQMRMIALNVAYLNLFGDLPWFLISKQWFRDNRNSLGRVLVQHSLQVRQRWINPYFCRKCLLKSQLEFDIPVWQVLFAFRGLPVWLCSQRLLGHQEGLGWLSSHSQLSLCWQKKSKIGHIIVLTEHFCWWWTGDDVVRREEVDVGNTNSNIFCCFELFYSPQSWFLLRFIIYCLAIWDSPSL